MNALVLLLAAAVTAPPGATVTPVTGTAERDAIIADLGRSAARVLDSKIAHCAEIYEYVAPMPVGRDTSFGAVCTLRSGRDVMMCDDRMVGKFTYSDRVRRGAREVEAFIAEHCPPGG